MLARRIIAVSADKALGEQLVTALQVTGATVELHADLTAVGEGTLPAALCVIHFDGALAAAHTSLPQLRAGCRVIAVLPRASLVSLVELMRASEQVAGMIIAEDFDPRQLAAMASRIITGDTFGLDKVMQPGTQIHAELVGNAVEKARCIAQVTELAELVGVPRKHHTAIEQCLDEMLMNALYDAAVDEAGRAIFANVPAKTRVTLHLDQPVAVQYAFDGKQFAISVRDAFGSLARETVLRVLHKCLHAEQQIDRKVGGAGVGLYLMVSSSTAVHFNVVPGQTTEAICTFDIEQPTLQLEQFGCFIEPTDVTGRLATLLPRRSPVGPPRTLDGRRYRAPLRTRRGLVAGLALAVVALAVLGVVALPRLLREAPTGTVKITTIPKGATIEIAGRVVGTSTSAAFPVELELGRSYPVVARLEGYRPKQATVHPQARPTALTLELETLAPTVELDSRPSGATVEIDGKQLGGTPLTLTTLAAGATVTIVFKRRGYRDATAQLRVPGAGEVAQHVQPLEVSDDFVRVRFVSNPPGAQIIELDGRTATAEGRTYTPAELFVEAGQVQRFMLTMPDHVPVVIAPFTPVRGAHGIEMGGDLVDGVTLRVEAWGAGKVSIVGAPHCQAVAVPAECTLAPGTHVVDYVGADAAKAKHTVTLAARPAIVKFELGAGGPTATVQEVAPVPAIPD